MDAAANNDVTSGSDFFARAREKLSPTPPTNLYDEHLPLRGDHDGDQALRALSEIKPVRYAAVLVPVINRREPSVLLTLRTDNLSTHAGQVAFPGGRIDDTDATPAETAMREAEEEIALDRRFVSVVGFSDIYLSGTGFRIVPVVARVEPGFELKPNPAEVADVFEVPLQFLMGPENHHRHSREWRGMMRSYYAMPFGDRYIWGVTAGILRVLYERLYA